MNLSLINQRIRKIKRENGQGELKEAEITDHPLDQFIEWFHDALDSGIYDPSAMVLATVDEKGNPDTRVVLLKELEQDRFIFFTNYRSKKARDLSLHPFAALNFYWPSLVRQVRIRGTIEKISQEQSAQYFATRPREAQIGVYASEQSATLKNREALDEKFKILAEKFLNQEIPCPDFWGGYALTPVEYEFFLGRKFRSHDRIFYSQENNRWQKVRLSP